VFSEAVVAADASVSSGVFVVARRRDGARGMMSDWPARSARLVLR
jgi:hypothetical protein